MFERLAGTLLTNLLAKYFSEESLAKNKISTSAQLGIWSGYISLHNLELKKDVINSILRRKGHPFEIVHCSFRQVEITVPWAKLTNPIKTASGGNKTDAVVVVVVDGIHLLARTKFTFDDIALREEKIRKRRKKLDQAGSVEKDPVAANGASSMSYTETLTKRITEGLLQEIIDKLHIHVRDLHIRLEDIESDPANPFACGVTFESMHVQHDEQETNLSMGTGPSDDVNDDEYALNEGMIRKVAQLNHFAIYWNALEYGEGVPLEHSVLQETYRDSTERLTRALDLCIARRASVMSSPSRNPYTPTHAYILLPLDGTLHGVLSSDPRNLEARPALVAYINVDILSVQLRDFQCVQILSFINVLKNHKFIKKYRTLRPLVPVKGNAMIWWQYATRVIRHQLKENYLRWSWSRFQQRYQLRGRYMDIYERKIRFPSLEQAETISEIANRMDESDIADRSSHAALALNGNEDVVGSSENGVHSIEGSTAGPVNATPDDGAGPSVPQTESQKSGPLSQSELNEIQDLEDGLRGDLSVNDIIMFRAVSNVRVGRVSGDAPNEVSRSSWWRSTVENVASDDSEAKDEFERLMKYIEKSKQDVHGTDTGERSLTAVSVRFRLEQGRVALFSPLSFTSDESQLRRLHERFLEFSIDDVRFSYSLMGDYASSVLQVSLFDFIATEIRGDRTHHVIATQPVKGVDGSNSPIVADSTEEDFHENPLFALTLTTNPPKSQDCDVELSLHVQTIDFVLVPACQWISRLKVLLRHISTVQSVADFWDDLSLAHVNSLALGRLGLLAKAESAGLEHKNMYLDINVHCPVLRISDGMGCSLVIDLGVAHLKTEKLAGVATTKLGHKSFTGLETTTNGMGYSDRVGESSTVNSFSTPTRKSRSRSGGGSPRKSVENYFYPSSPMSVDTRTYPATSTRSLGGIMRFDDSSSTFPPMDPVGGFSSGTKGPDDIHTLFYDIYQLHIVSGKITIEMDDEASPRTLTTEMEVRTTIHKSVLPADHTLCKLKAHSVVADFSVQISQSTIVKTSNLVETWKSVVAGQGVSESLPIRQYSSTLPADKLLVKRRRRSTSSVSSGNCSLLDDDDSLSQVNENEFFDATDDHDSFNADTSAVWFEDNWITDAESVIDADSRSLPTPDRRGRKRQPSIISDVSSASDQSDSVRRRRHQNIDEYLSAENLARLEEGAGEDESMVESGGESDNDSFHSAVSIGGQIRLARELEEDIEKAENQIHRLQDKMAEPSMPATNGSTATLAETKQRRQVRKSIRVDLERLGAELSALRALRSDLETQIMAVEEPVDSEKFEKAHPRPGIALDGVNQPAKRARALLSAKKKRDSMLGNDAKHSLIRDLNRELFQGSILFNQLQVKFHLEDEESAETADSSIFEICASQTGVAFYKCVHDTKLYFSIDSISATLESEGLPTQFLALGGTNDSLRDIQLPSHFPQYIAYSMEERFLRGAIHKRTKRIADENNSQSQTLKLRLVVGDLELTPNHQALTDLLSFRSSLRAIPGMSPDESMGRQENSLQASGNTTGRNVPPLSNNAALSSDPTKYFDLAVRFTSIRTALSHNNQMVAACTLAETSMRCVHVSSDYTFKSRTQVDLRCSNFQVLDVINVEAGRATEVCGRSDPYSHLVNIRLRRQLVLLRESGGWVVGSENESLDGERSHPDQLVWNLHLGARLTPIGLVASPRAISRISDSIFQLRNVFAERRVDAVDPGPDGSVSTSGSRLATSEDMSPVHPVEPGISSVPKIATRWRVDLSLRRASILFPNQTAQEWIISDDIRHAMVMTWSLLASFQETIGKRDGFSSRLAVTDLSLIRSSDDWPVVASHSIIYEMDMMKKVGICNKLEKPHLKLPPDSPWNEITAVMHRYGWDAMPERPIADFDMSLALKITPIKVSVSAPLVGLILNISRSFGAAFPKKDVAAPDASISTEVLNLSTPTPKKKLCLGLNMSLDQVDIRLLREKELRPISSADELVSFTMTDVTMAYEQGAEVVASIFIRESSLFDLSCRPGVRVLGEDPTKNRNFVVLKSPYFVRIKFHASQSHDDSPKTARLDINWGRIQCIVLPSLLRSLLTFKDDVKKLTAPSAREKSGDGDLMSRFFNLRYDTNILLSADTEAFECILSSRDIGAYLREKCVEPIGVVSFRWKAALNISLALDSLRGVSVPWITLNPDGDFTDFEDMNLFKEFSNRYLDQSSGLLAGSDEVGYRLINAFTSRVKLSMSDFQALRTYMSSPQLGRSPTASTESCKGFESGARIVFVVDPPLVGERRITNSIDFQLTHRLAGASMSVVDANGYSSEQIEVAQLLQLKSNFVDVLVYISQSAGGSNEAFRVTVKPIMEMFKGKEHGKRKEDHAPNPAEESVNAKRSPPSLFAALQKAPTMCSIQAEGFQVTFVPGGATRLTESPIIKFELSRFSFGLAAVPVSKDVRLMTDTNLNNFGKSQSLVSGVDVMHLTAAAWVQCEVSADYHNRRLVAWEPFIEPWTADVRLGADLVEALQPSNLSTWSPSSQSIQSPFDALSSGKINERAGGRLRDIGRLFRAPFKSISSAKPAENESYTDFISHADFSYLMLASTARNSILTVLHPSTGARPEKETVVFSTLPSHQPMNWLHAFGFPQHIHEGQSQNSRHSVVCMVTDTRPLNVNLTGALIENVMGYLNSEKQEGYRTVAPHWIRNDSGMTIRLQEVLEGDRISRGDKAGKTTLSNGCEVPLTLKRSLSQSCDPHRAYIFLELGSFEDTVGRVQHDEFDNPKGSRWSNFFFKTAAKIPVDMVGVHRYPLDRNVEKRTDLQVQGADSRALGWIIVRVALKGGIKVVSVESPFVLKSNADSDLLCEIRDHNGLSLLWRCLIPKTDEDHATSSNSKVISVPADIVPFLRDGAFVFSVMALSRESHVAHEAELLSVSQEGAVEVPTPPPFSPSSFSRGVISESEIALAPISPKNDGHEGFGIRSEKIFLNVCSVRIGSFSGVTPTIDVPEQCMLFFRSPLVFKNHLALPVTIQVRVKKPILSEKKQSSSGSPPSRKSGEPLARQPTSIVGDWEDLGILDCAQSVNWTGALSSDKVELRVRFAGRDGENSRLFPSWSTSISIPAKEKGAKANTRSASASATAVSQMKILDASGVPLYLSISLAGSSGGGESDPTAHDNIRLLSQNFVPAARVVSIYVPYWIVDGTGQDLEFFSGASVAGQLSNLNPGRGKQPLQQRNGITSGLAELLEDDKLIHLPSRSPFEVMMIGDHRSTRLTVRRSLTRKNGKSIQKRIVSPWSEPIPLRADQNSQYDVTVLSPSDSASQESPDGRDITADHRCALRSSIINAPARFGGNLGTKLIRIVNRYAILNEMGRDIEIASEYGHGIPILVRAASRPRPFHFDDSSPMRFRFKEFGWSWSGRFSIRENRREVTLRVRQKMKEYTIIATVEVHARKKSATSLIIFRQASHPPFRLENHTMYPLHFGQSKALLGPEESALDSMLLPYQSANFAWDEPEVRRRAMIVKAAGSTDLPSQIDAMLGRFYLDRIAPGTELKLESPLFSGEIVADGPTRVLRISDASMPRLPSFRQDQPNDLFQKRDISRVLTLSLVVRLSHGIGVSIVDWSPQELVYARLDDIMLERKVNSNKETVSLAVGNIKVNNQLWVTPYPVLLKMGRRVDDSLSSRRRNRRQNAVLLSWRRLLTANGGYGDFTLLERVEFSAEPVFINADGSLADLLIRMVKQISEKSSTDRHVSTLLSRDDELRRMLDLVDSAGSEAKTDEDLGSRSLAAFDWGSNSDFLVTSAIAAKLKVNAPRSSAVSALQTGSTTPMRSSKDNGSSLSKPLHKYYIEKLRISAAKSELSWSGPLPGKFSSLLLRAFTFEGLPLRLLPFSNSHVYGTVEDHMQSLKSHYLSFWRIVDLVMGLSSNPTFMIRAVVYTGRESVASMFDSWSETFKNTAEGLQKSIQNETEFQPTYDDGLPVQQPVSKSLVFKRAAFGPFITLTSFLLRCSASFNAWGSSLLRYGPQNYRSTRGLVRSRNPRLFANIDGKDLLVEYVEGENAGKALLSRVRMGIHLGEGYIFHTEGAKLKKIKPASPTAMEMESAPLIVMMTSERVLLLNGKLDRNFCSVVWEAMFENIVHVEFLPMVRTSQPCDLVVIWYLSDAGHSAGNGEDRKARYANTLVGHLDTGVDVLHSKSIFVPSETGKQFLERMERVDRSITDDVSGQSTIQNTS